jgi:hypothetical protein
VRGRGGAGGSGGSSGARSDTGSIVGSGAPPAAIARIRATTSGVNPISSTSSQVLPASLRGNFGSGSIGDALSTLPSSTITTWFGSSRLSVTSPPGSLWNGTFIDSNLPLRSLRV